MCLCACACARACVYVVCVLEPPSVGAIELSVLCDCGIFLFTYLHFMLKHNDRLEDWEIKVGTTENISLECKLIILHSIY